MKGCVWRGKAIAEQLLDGQVVMQTLSFNLEFLLVPSHIIGCFYRFLPAGVEPLHHRGITRGHVGGGVLRWYLHKATSMTMWLYSIHWNLTESHPWTRSTSPQAWARWAGCGLSMAPPDKSLQFFVFVFSFASPPHLHPQPSQTNKAGLHFVKV